MESIDESLSIFTNTFTDHIRNEFEVATVQTAISTDQMKLTGLENTLDLESLKISESMRCNSCDIDLSNRDEQVTHYKSDWHRCNLKRKLKNLEKISEEKFDVADVGDISSISGSDSESELEEIIDESSVQESDHKIRHPRLFLRNKEGKLFSIFHCILYNKKDEPENENDLREIIKGLAIKTKWSIFMLSGGHFAGAVFDKNAMILHKTFHRYVVRAKRGTVQSQHDKKGGHAKSAGANLRRYNEASLTQQIQNILKEWSCDIATSSRIFIRCSMSSRSILFSGKSPVLLKDDKRITHMPFPTRRPTLKEVQRVHAKLSNCLFYSDESVLVRSPPQKVKKSPVRRENIKSNTSKRKKRRNSIDSEEIEKQESSTEDDEDDCITNYNLTAAMETFSTGNLKEYEHSFGNKKEDELKKLRNEIYTYCKYGDESKLKDALKDSKVTKKFLNERFGREDTTFLHTACKNKFENIIVLLLDVGCDPTIRDKSGSYPYVVAQDRQTRNILRKYRTANPTQYDYEKAQVSCVLNVYCVTN
ncbi:DgyrCDS6614 [Dimorphilus gyrociliatus]|uniref:DgyrCDS6614 n=2 Tax=Dimorphilus gyrociliatus TaxID=2664684 RepID=A0A7I8VNL5_9ANNE|nr:DgyrCDS6614 [Dimorphilus gyrociliatus]